MKACRSLHPRNARHGGVLVEFALIALILYLLLAGTFELGRALYSAQMLQQAADTAGRELAHAALPADTTFENGLQKSGLFNDEMLILDPGTDIGTLPAINQALYPLMISDQVTLDGTERNVLRYPGAILKKPDGAFTVGIPVVVSRSGAGTETIDWAPVIEEIKQADGTGSFSIASRQRGLVALRINYPYQAAALSGFMDRSGGALQPGQVVIQANDAGVQADNAPPDNGTVVDPGQAAGVYAGAYGLGRQFALAQTVRPFRKLLAAQAIYRREVFQP